MGAALAPYLILNAVREALGKGKFTGSVPEEWREYRAIQIGVVVPQRYDDQNAAKTDLFIAFAGLEHEAAERAAARHRNGGR